MAMSPDEYNQVLFERMHSDQRWESQPAKGWSVEDLDVAEIRRTITEAVQRGRLQPQGLQEPAELLRGLGLFQGGVLSRAAVVLFGNTERIRSEMPQCLLRIARFRGVDRTEFLDNRQFHGNAFTLLTNAENFLRETLPIAGRLEAGRIERIDEPLYPPLATRESLVNALCHRDYIGGGVGVAVYADRLEMTSPGTLHFGLTPEKLFAGHESRPWNPLIARSFYLRGIIEAWGSGTTKMVELAISAGLPHPEIEDTGECVTVCFRHGQAMPSQRDESDLSEQQQAILNLLTQSDRALALREIRSQLKPQSDEKRQFRKDLEILKARGLVKPTGRGRGASWKPL